MTVAELIAALAELPADALVVQSKDSEGNSFSPVDSVSTGRYAADSTWSGTFGLVALTPELEEEGYSDKDVPAGPIAVCIWPTN